MNDSKISQTPPNTKAHTTPMQRALVEAKAAATRGEVPVGKYHGSKGACNCRKW